MRLNEGNHSDRVMGAESDLTSVLGELIEFLECLGEVKLPETLENVRETLLQRSKNTLALSYGNVSGLASSSPEPYLEMNAGKGVLIQRKDEEYIKSEGNNEKNEGNQPNRRQDYYYETFDNPLVIHSQEEKNELENILVEIYNTISASQMRSTCHICGPLFRKDGKKLFMFEQYRPCWIGLVGSHLLIYGSEKDSRPQQVMSIRGYMARPASHTNPRDQKRAESAFEIFSPGNKTLQFVASTPKDMERWVSKICQIGLVERENCSIPLQQKEITEQEENPAEETFGQEFPSKSPPALSEKSLKVKIDAENRILAENLPPENGIPPPLPSRSPRKLPSLPVTEETVRVAYNALDDDEDDIYHRIEDFKGYQNVSPSKKDAGDQGETRGRKNIETYDDVEALSRGPTTLSTFKPSNNDNGKPRRGDKEDKGEVKLEKATDHVPEKEEKVEEEAEETYDDVFEGQKLEKGATEIYDDVKSKTGSSGFPDTPEEISYDDVENLQVDNKEKASQETPNPKRSFLDRVRNRSKGDSKKSKRKAKNLSVESEPKVVEAVLPTYDDVSEIRGDVLEDNASGNNDYNCPPPPRPIYTKPPIVEELYDDILSVQTRTKEEPVQVQVQVQVEDEDEHYQRPRSQVQVVVAVQQQETGVRGKSKEEELYDDIAILRDFKTRPRKEVDGSKRPWNRFGSARKSCKGLGSWNEDEKKVSSGNSSGCNEDAQEGAIHVRMNSFQKLINRMESSLGKTVPILTANKNQSSMATRENGSDC